MTQPLTKAAIESLLQELHSAKTRRRIRAVKLLDKLEASNGRIAAALETVAATDSNEYIRLIARQALLAPAHQPFTYIRDTLPVAPSTGHVPISATERAARNWYWWLWLSPLVTVPSLIILLFNEPGRALVCDGNWRGCDHNLASSMTILIAILGSALWHLILLIPALNKESEFIRWHGRQALLLAGVRTAIPFGFGLVFGERSEVLCFIPILIAVWFFGTLWGQLQADRGNCSLMRWFGQAEALPVRAQVTTAVGGKQLGPDALVEIIRYSRDPAERRQALSALEQLGMVKTL